MRVVKMVSFWILFLVLGTEILAHLVVVVSKSVIVKHLSWSHATHYLLRVLVEGRLRCETILPFDF